MIPTNTTKNK
jgi:hypothetical protein